ncbi:MAG: NHL repeat-containing protein [candidate division WOR-3 bacterium]
MNLLFLFYFIFLAGNKKNDILPYELKKFHINKISLTPYPLIKSPLFTENKDYLKILKNPQAKLTPIPLVTEPQRIDKFCKEIACQIYKGCEFFFLPYNICVIETPAGKMIFVTDYKVRICFTFEGAEDIGWFGEFGTQPHQFKGNIDIDGKFPYFYISDPGNGRISMWEIKILEIPVSWGKIKIPVPYFLKTFGEGILITPWGIDYSDNGTPEIQEDDKLFVTDMSKRKIFKFTYDGIVVDSFGKYGYVCGSPRRWGKMLFFVAPQDVVVGKENGVNNNIIYVSDPGNGRIVMFKDSSGVKKIINSFNFFEKRRRIGKRHGLPFMIDVDDAGFVYASVRHDKIIKFYPDLSDTVWTYGENGIGLGKFNYLTGIHIYKDKLFAAEKWGPKSGIMAFQIGEITDNIPPECKIISPPDSTFVNGKIKICGRVKDNSYLKYYYIWIKNTKDSLVYASFGTQEKINEPLAIFNADSVEEGLYKIILIASDFSNNISTDEVLIYAGEPKPVLKIGEKGLNPSQLRLPCDVAVDSQFIYIADSQNDRVQKFNKYGNFILTFGKHGKNKGEFIQPDFISYYKNKLFVSDRNNSRIEIFDLKGNYLFEFGGPHIFNQTGGVSFDKNGNIYISDIHHHRINVFDQQGNYIRSFGEYGDTTGKLNQPHGIFILDTLIYIANRQNNRVEVFNINGKFKKTIGKEGVERGEFSHPYDIVIDMDSSLYVSDQHNNRIQKFDKFGNVLLNIYGKKLENGLKQPKGLSIDKKFLYVTDTYNDRVVLFPLKIGYSIDSLAKYDVKPGDMIIVYEDGKIYFVLNIQEEKGIKRLGGITKSFVELSIVDVSGRKIDYLIKGFYPPGKIRIKLDKKIPSGTYFIEGKISQNKIRKKFVFLK